MAVIDTHRTTVEPGTTPATHPEASGRTGLDRARSTWARLRDPRGDAIVLAPLLVAAGVLMRVGLYSAPQRIDDEGTYVAQAWAVFHLGELTHYTYWYDHPPLGWMQIALWTEATGGFDRAPNAVGAGRELMVVLALVSAGLLWALCRRLSMPRWAAGVAVALFTLSPLAVQLHRTVYLDNVATPWLLASFLLALSPKRRLGEFAGAAVCFAIAVLSKETFFLLFPVVAFLLWTRSRGDTRRYAVAVASTLFVLSGAFYVLFALLKGEVVPGADRTSLMGGIVYQLGGRKSSGSIFDPESLGHRTVSIWLQLDTVFPVLALVAVAGALLVRRLRPFALATLLLLLMLVRPGYLPVPFVIVLLPLGALLVAGLAAATWAHRPATVRGHDVRRAGGAVAFVVALTVAGLTAPAWASQLRGLTIAPLDQPMTDATAWIDANVPRDQRILTDDALWVDLVEQGRDRGDVVWFYKPDTDPAVPKGVDSYQWVVSTDSVRSDPAAFPTLSESLARSEPAASFGTGERRVEVRRILAQATDPTALAARQAAAAAAGQQLVANPAIRLTGPARADLLSGRVDARLLTLLATTAATHEFTIDDLPQPSAEEAAGATRRSVRITSVDGQAATQDSRAADALAGAARTQVAPYRADATFVAAVGDVPGALVLTYPRSTS